MPNPEHPLKGVREQRELLESMPLPRRFEQALVSHHFYPLQSTGIEILQINVGRVCNQTCQHCHVGAGPDRKESMSPEVVQAILTTLENNHIPTLDITGGAPELHPQFRELVEQARALDRHVIDRCNLTILLVRKYQELPEFLAHNQVEVVASLPSYNLKQTDAQRGRGVFEGSLEGLRRLNKVGYGRNPKLQLNLVTNPVGAFLPANQSGLEKTWKRELKRRFDIDFNNLYTITNLPISRFLEYLYDSDNLDRYMERLVNAYNPVAAEGVMCRTMLSVGWEGDLYDCDFNQMLEMPLTEGAPRTIFEFNASKLSKRRIVTGQHCFGCTAGGGSSCGGATTGG